MEANRRPTESAEPGASAPLEHASRAGLEQAFALFNQMSNQLSESYSLLEARVNELKGQLALVSAQRMQELAEKERLANRLQNLLPDESVDGFHYHDNDDHQMPQDATRRKTP